MATTAFDDVRLPEDIEAGALVGPVFNTTVISLSGGGEQRNQDWDQEKLSADISYGIMAKDDPQDIENSFLRVLKFFRERRGRHRSFRFHDVSDDTVTRGVLFADPVRVTFQLCKVYGTYIRKITRPVYNTIVIYANGVVAPSTGTITPAWQINETGLLTFAAAVPGGVEITASFVFDVPMRFDSDVVQLSLEHLDAGSIGAIKLIQVVE